MPFAESSPPVPPPHLRPEVVVPYHAPAGARNENDRYPDALYEYVWNAPDRIPGTTRVTHAGEGGVFVLIILPHPLLGLNLTSGTTTRVLAAILHEETLAGDPALVTVDGWLCDDIAEAQSNWDEFILQDAEPPTPLGFYPTNDNTESDLDP